MPEPWLCPLPEGEECPHANERDELLEKIQTVTKKLKKRIRDVHKQRDGGEGFTNGLEFAVQELEETFSRVTHETRRAK